MFNDVRLAASVITAVMGSMHLACICGTFYLRDASVFASRVPKVVLGSMLMKMIGFFLCAWLFLDADCPCGVVPFMFIVDWTGSCWLMLKRVVLLFRYEIQAALEHSKAQTGGVTLDESNFFVRYRQLLRPKVQTYWMFGILGYLALGNMIVLAIFNERALAPCTFESFQENKLTFGCILFAWITAFPMMGVSLWAARRLKKFPNDNWKMGTENSIASMFTVVASVCCAVTLIVIPEFDGILWVLFAGSIFVTALQFLLPLNLHRRTLSQLAKFHITTLTSLDRLLLSSEFVSAFRAFLKKEFSSENLDFWVEVNRLQERYGHLFPSTDETRSRQEDDSERVRLLAEAARECKILGLQCVGSAAPWQLNISGYSMEAMEAAVRELNDAMGTQGVGLAVEELLKTFSMVQQEVYETLRLDPYPRFLLTSALGTLNQDENFKRMLAAEKLEDDVQKSLGTSKKRHTTTDGSSEKHSADSKKSSKKTAENENKNRASHATGSSSAPAEGSQAALRSSDISSAENSRNVP